MQPLAERLTGSRTEARARDTGSLTVRAYEWFLGTVWPVNHLGTC